MTRWIHLIVLLAAGPALLAQEPKKDEPKPQEAKPEMKTPADASTASAHPRVKMETTLGDIIIELDEEKAPISTLNFADYVLAGYYDNTVFHRVIKDFMIQGGGFTNEMKPKQEGLRPPIKNEWNNGLKNQRGAISMARSSAADSATAQFFINVVDNIAGAPHDLDTPRPGGGNAAYAVFGKVVEGMDVVDKIRDSKLTENPGYKTPEGPVTPDPLVVIKSAKMVGAFDRAPLAARVADLEKTAKAAAEKQKQEDMAKSEKQLQDFIANLEKETGKKVEKTASGLMYVIMKEGTGPQPKKTDKVQVHYTGKLLNGEKFDSSVDRGQPFEFSLAGGVIQGWLEGVALMKVGESRKLIIPPDLAYGARGAPPKIAPNSTLVFDVELLAIK